MRKNLPAVTIEDQRIDELEEEISELQSLLSEAHELLSYYEARSLFVEIHRQTREWLAKAERVVKP